METVSDMIAGFLAGLTPGTRAGYRSVVSRWLRWCADNGIDMLRAKRTHTACFGQKKPSLLAGEVRAIRMTVQFRPTHMLARIAVDIPLLAEIAVEAANDAQIPAHRVFRRWPHAAVIGGEHLDMGALRPQHVEAVEAALDAVDGIEEVQGNPPDHVDLLYYRSQEHYDRYGRDKGDYAIVNARSREIAAILESQGIEARFRYPEDDEAGFQRLANTR